MKLNHLAIAVADQQRSIEFYATYFGFDAGSARWYPDGVVIITDADGFALALGRADGPAPEPGFPHFGFEPETADEVRRFRARLLADGIPLVEDEDEPSYVGIKCLDPDRHVVEVAWEP